MIITLNYWKNSILHNHTEQEIVGHWFIHECNFQYECRMYMVFLLVFLFLILFLSSSTVSIPIITSRNRTVTPYMILKISSTKKISCENRMIMMNVHVCMYLTTTTSSIASLRNCT